MPNKTFEYDEIVHAEHDLALFSRMNAHEDKPLYLCNNGNGKYQIEHSVEACGRNKILFIALNGVVFYPHQ